MNGIYRDGEKYWVKIDNLPGWREAFDSYPEAKKVLLAMLYKADPKDLPRARRRLLEDRIEQQKGERDAIRAWNEEVNWLWPSTPEAR